MGRPPSKDGPRNAKFEFTGHQWMKEAAEAEAAKEGVTLATWLRGVISSKLQQITPNYFQQIMQPDISKEVAPTLGDPKEGGGGVFLNSGDSAHLREEKTLRDEDAQHLVDQENQGSQPCARAITGSSGEQEGTDGKDVTDTKKPFSEDFEMFWKEYPSGRKRDKKDAFNAWKQVLKDGAQKDKIMESVKEYAGSPLGKSQYVKMPASWLRKWCWMDERTSWQNDGSNNGNGNGNGKPHVKTEKERLMEMYPDEYR